MSSTAEDTELKAGHPPAVKAGGMRVARAHRNSSGDKNPTPAEEGEEEVAPTTTVTKSERHNQQVLVSGVLGKGDGDFTPDAIRTYHDKPTSAKEKRPLNVTHNIQQPR